MEAGLPNSLSGAKKGLTWPIVIVGLIIIIIGAYFFLVYQINDSKEVANNPAPALSTNGNNSEAEDTAVGKDLTFIPDTGIRVENASLPGIKMNADGTFSLLYEARTDPRGWYETTSQDGLVFSGNKKVSDEVVHSYRAHKLPDGTYRAYNYEKNSTGLTSYLSTDGVKFEKEAGFRYNLQAADNGTMGIYDFFNDKSGNVVLLYIGDMFGKNNVRRAYSVDNGKTFTFTNGNVFGDDSEEKASAHYVDQKSVVLADGRIRVFTMKEGLIYSFISEDGKTFTKEPGIRLQPSDFKDLQIASFHDPVFTRLSDGRYRMYVCAKIGGPEAMHDDNAKQVIVSAITPN